LVGKRGCVVLLMSRGLRAALPQSLHHLPSLNVLFCWYARQRRRHREKDGREAYDFDSGVMN